MTKTTSTQTKNDKLISLRMPVSIVDFAKKDAKKQGRTVSNYLRWLIIQQMDETSYIMQDKKLYAHLLESKNNPIIAKSFTLEEFEKMTQEN
jgi:predicted DNA-binding protein